MGSFGVDPTLGGQSYTTASMWYEYEPLLTSPRKRSCTPERKVPYPFPQSYPNYSSHSHSGPVVYPSYQAYLSGMGDYDYYYQGYKTGYTPPVYRQSSLASLTARVNLRWTK